LGEILNPDFDKDFFGLQDYLGSASIPQTWQYTGIESPNGEAGFLVMFNQSVNPYRVKIKTPSMPLVQALTHFVSGIREEQLRPYLASLGIRQFELDR
jgi:NADH:ubiquinone oxidoreductase subunit D